MATVEVFNLPGLDLGLSNGSVNLSYVDPQGTRKNACFSISEPDLKATTAGFDTFELPGLRLLAYRNGMISVTWRGSPERILNFIVRPLIEQSPPINEPTSNPKQATGALIRPDAEALARPDQSEDEAGQTVVKSEPGALPESREAVASQHEPDLNENIVTHDEPEPMEAGNTPERPVSLLAGSTEPEPRQRQDSAVGLELPMDLTEDAAPCIKSELDYTLLEPSTDRQFEREMRNIFRRPPGLTSEQQLALQRKKVLDGLYPEPREPHLPMDLDQHQPLTAHPPVVNASRLAADTESSTRTRIGPPDTESRHFIFVENHSFKQIAQKQGVLVLDVDSKQLRFTPLFLHSPAAVKDLKSNAKVKVTKKEVGIHDLLVELPFAGKYKFEVLSKSRRGRTSQPKCSHNRKYLDAFLAEVNAVIGTPLLPKPK